MHLTDEQLRHLVAADPTNERLLRELRFRTSLLIIRKMPARRGVWRGRPVILDEKGAMASGYWGFVGGNGYPPVETWSEITITPDPERERLSTLLATLKTRP